jgi:hypothetical protein
VITETNPKLQSVTYNGQCPSLHGRHTAHTNVPPPRPPPPQPPGGFVLVACYAYRTGAFGLSSVVWCWCWCSLLLFIYAAGLNLKAAPTTGQSRAARREEARYPVGHSRAGKKPSTQSFASTPFGSSAGGWVPSEQSKETNQLMCESRSNTALGAYSPAFASMKRAVGYRCANCARAAGSSSAFVGSSSFAQCVWAWWLGSKRRKCQTAVSNCIDLGRWLHLEPTHPESWHH